MLRILREYEINIHQILACALDNAANMTSTVKLLNEQQSMGEDENETSEEIETKEEITNFGQTIYYIQCAEHTFQLGIRDALKKGRPEKFQSKIRKIAQFLRSPHTAK